MWFQKVDSGFGWHLNVGGAKQKHTKAKQLAATRHAVQNSKLLESGNAALGQHVHVHGEA